MPQLVVSMEVMYKINIVVTWKIIVSKCGTQHIQTVSRKFTKMKTLELINNYPDLEDYLKLFKGYKDYTLKTEGLNAIIHIKSCGLEFELSNKDLSNLSTGDKIKNSGYTHINHCGFVYKNYGEISITVVPSKYSFSKDSSWYANPLKFKIGKKRFEIDSASPLFVLLNEPIYRDSDWQYRDSDWQYDFQEFTSIKIINTNIHDIKADTIKALYYLNSHYLKKIGFVAKIYQMNINDEDEIDLWGDEIIDLFKKVNRIRSRTRNDFASIEPLIMYNKAQTLNNDEKFLYLYRILEFFMQRARIQKVAEMRLDKNYSDIVIIKTIENKNEEKQLNNLLNEVVNPNQKKRITDYAFVNKLIKDKDYNKLSNSLYKYRNSIVHAKEQQISEIKIPDPFEQEFENNPWLIIIDELARKSIIKYNKTSG